MHSALDYALGKGVEYAELHASSAARTGIEVQNGEVKELSGGDGRVFSVRVLYRGGVGIAFSTKEDYKVLLDKAIKAAKSFGKGLHLQRLEGKRMKVRTKCKILPGDVSVEGKKDALLRLDVRREFKSVRSLRLLYSDVVRTRSLETSEGREFSWDDVVTGFVVQAYSKEGVRAENFHDVERGHLGYEVMDGAELLVRNAMRLAQDLLKAKHPRGGVFPVITDQRLGGVFAHEAVGHGCEADIVLQGASVLGGKVGQKLASGCLSIVDDGRKEGLYGWVPFDDEGVEAQETALIKEGVLKGYLHSRETAALMGAEPTGNGRVEALGLPAIPRMRCTFVENGDADFSELVKGVKSGYYLKGTAGGEVNPANGEFLFNAQYGFRVEKGELKEMVKGASLAGRLLDVLPKVALVADDLKFSHGTCGKNGQGVPVSDGAPHMLLEGARVGGQG